MPQNQRIYSVLPPKLALGKQFLWQVQLWCKLFILGLFIYLFIYSEEVYHFLDSVFTNVLAKSGTMSLPIVCT